MSGLTYFKDPHYSYAGPVHHALLDQITQGTAVGRGKAAPLLRALCFNYLEPISMHNRMDRLQEIITENFLLREIESNDLNAVYEIFSDPNVIRYWDHIAWVDLSEASSFIQEAHSGFAEYRHFYWCGCKKDTGVIVGISALRDYSQNHKTIEIPYAVHAGFWAKGIASEIIPEVVAFGFWSLDLNRIHAITEPGNIASTKVLPNIGFKLEGRLRENWIYSGEAPTDTNMLGLIKNDWLQSKT